MPHKGLFKKAKRTVKRAGRTISRVQRRSDRFVAKNVRKATKSVGKGVSAAAKRVRKTRVSANVSKGPFTSAFKFAKKVIRLPGRAKSKSPTSKLRKFLGSKTRRRRPRRR